MTELAQMKVENILELFTPYLLAKDQPNEEKFITAQEYLKNSEYNLPLQYSKKYVLNIRPQTQLI